MEYKEFVDNVDHAVSAYLGEDYSISLRKVPKNNGVVLTGIVIMHKQEMIAPTIYLEQFYLEHEEGRSFGDIVMHIVSIYENNRVKGEINLDFLTDYQIVKGRIFQKIVNYERNKERLKDIPHKRFLDLAIVCYIAYMNDFLGNGAISISTEYLDSWGISEEQLFLDAKQNTMEKLGVDVKGMADVLMEVMTEKIENREDDEVNEILPHLTKENPMYIMTLRGRFFGAVCIAYSEYLKNFGGKCLRNFYILPSSVHELILIPDSGREDIDGLKNMVCEVNSTHVALEEQLSDNVYYYDIKNNQITLA